MWLDVIKTLKKDKGLSVKQLAEMTNLPERSIARIFNGETTNPYMTTLIPIVNALGVSLDYVFSDSKVVVATETVVELQETVEEVNAEKSLVIADYELLEEKYKRLEKELETANKELALTKTELAYTKKLLAVHEYYTKIKCD